MRRFVSGIGNDSLYLWKFLCSIVVDCIKNHAVMDISGSRHGFQHETVLVTCSMGFVGKLPLVVSFCEQAAVRVGYAFGNHARLIFLAASQLFPGGVISAFFSAALAAHFRHRKTFCRVLPGLR